MNSQHFVSIVVPVYNGETTILQCIESLLAQDYPSYLFEIVVVDNGSTDETCNLLSRYAHTSRIKLLSETQTLNAYGARNTGAKVAQGEILAFTDADCFPSLNWLSQLLSNASDTTIGVFIGDIMPYQPTTVLERYYSVAHMSIKERTSEFIGMRGGNCAIRRECFTALNGFNALVPSGGDSDFLVRLLQKTTYRYRIVPTAVVYHKNLVTLSAIFRRNLRFGTNIHNVIKNPYLRDSYLRWDRLSIAIIRNILAVAFRFIVYPIVQYTGYYRGQKIGDMELFLIEPLVRLTELAGLTIGRVVQSKHFR